MEITRKRERVFVEEFSLNFAGNNTPGGFGFPCTKEGEPILDGMSEIARKNLADCLNGTLGVTPVGVVNYSYHYWTPAEGRCENCRRTVVLSSAFANECECGVEYNGFGQRLAPRSQWEEEY